MDIFTTRKLYEIPVNRWNLAWVNSGLLYYGTYSTETVGNHHYHQKNKEGKLIYLYSVLIMLLSFCYLFVVCSTVDRHATDLSKGLV